MSQRPTPPFCEKRLPPGRALLNKPPDRLGVTDIVSTGPDPGGIPEAVPPEGGSWNGLSLGI